MAFEPQPTTEIIALYEKSQDNVSKITSTLAQKGQAASKMAEIKNLMEDVGNGNRRELSPSYVASEARISSHWK